MKTTIEYDSMHKGVSSSVRMICLATIATVTFLSLSTIQLALRGGRELLLWGRFSSVDDDLASNVIVALSDASSIVKDEHHIQSWCPVSSLKYCQKNVVCEPCKRRFVIIISSGRAASTTLTRMVGSLPGIRMGGENNDLLTNLHHSIEETTTHESFIKGTNQTDAWGHQEIQPGSLSCGVQSTMHAINPPSSPSPTEEEESMILGFKTIRFHWSREGEDNGDEALYKKVQFLKQSFPCAKFIVNTRASDRQGHIRSVKIAFQDTRTKEEIRNQVIEENRRLKMVYEWLLEEEGHDDPIRDRVLRMDSHRWLNNITMFNTRLIDWLGYSQECYFEEFLQFNHVDGVVGGYKAGQESLIHPHRTGCRLLSQ